MTSEHRPRPWRLRETVMALAIAVVIAAVGGAAIYAATGRSSSQFPGPPGHPSGPGGGPPGGIFGAAAPR